MNAENDYLRTELSESSSLAERNLRTHREAAEKARTIAVEGGARLDAQLPSCDVAPTIISLQNQFETMRREVLVRYRPKLGVLTVQQEEALKLLTCSLVNKIAHLPITEIRRQAGADSRDQRNGRHELISAVWQIFRLDDNKARCERLSRP